MVKKAILLLLSLLIGCEGMDVSRDRKACLDSLDPKLLGPNGYIDLDYNEIQGLPLLTLKPENQANFRALSINVGNGEVHNDPYDRSIKYLSFEENIAQRIQDLYPRPNIIALQEVLTEKRCAKLHPEDRLNNPEQSCWYRDSTQVQRLVGPEYAIVCDGNFGVDCLAVLKSWAKIDFSATAPLPPTGFEEKFSLCDYSKGECIHHSNRCDQESSVAHASLTLKKDGKKFNAVFLHPTASGESCMNAQLVQALEYATSSPGVPTIMLGDWNFENVRFTGRRAGNVIVNKFVGPGREFRFHDNVDESCTFAKTGPHNLTTLDHVASNFAHGMCRVYGDMSQLYYSPLNLFDEGILEEIFPDGNIPQDYASRRLDHKAVLCDLYAPDQR